MIFFKVLLSQKTSRTTDNGKPRLQNTECSFNVFSGCLLHPCKFTLFFCFGFFDALDKCAPRRVYTICKIVPLCVFMPIDSIVASRSITTSKPSKQMRPLQHIDIIESARHTKKAMPNPLILGCYGLWHNCSITRLATILHVPCLRAVFPSPMHAINAS